MFKNSQSKGFTLIELLVTTTIMIVLTTIGLVSYKTASKNSRNAKRKSDLETVRQALVLYRTDNNIYPVGSVFVDMIDVIDDDYLSVTTIKDPKDTGSYVYTYSSADGSTFQICAMLEPDPGTSYCLNNP
jgi:general secretion pathway protein G